MAKREYIRKSNRLLPIKGSLLERILARVKVLENGCWEWQGTISPCTGYGVIGVDGITVGAHRMSFIAHGGVFTEDKPLIDHVCHNPKLCVGGLSCPHRRCVNPDHLEASSHAMNLAVNRRDPTRMIEWSKAYRASFTQCPQGHPYDEKNTGIKIQKRNGGLNRRCRACAREYARRRRLTIASQNG